MRALFLAVWVISFQIRKWWGKWTYASRNIINWDVQIKAKYNKLLAVGNVACVSPALEFRSFCSNWEISDLKVSVCLHSHSPVSPLLPFGPYAPVGPRLPGAPVGPRSAWGFWINGLIPDWQQKELKFWCPWTFRWSVKTIIITKRSMSSGLRLKNEQQHMVHVKSCRKWTHNFSP